MYGELKKKFNVSQVLAIFFIQATSTIAYAVFYSGLSIFLTQNKHYSQQSSATLTGLFLSLNYLLPLIGGMIANRIISYKNLFILCGIASFFSCLVLASGHYLHFSLALFLMSSLANVSLSMFVTQLFSPEQVAERRAAFTWNYVGMNVGFMLGYLLTGFSTIANSYYYLFVLMSSMICGSLLITYFCIKEPITQQNSRYTYKDFICSLCVIISLVILIKFVFDYAEFFRSFLTVISIISAAVLINYCLKKSAMSERKNIIKFLCFSLVAIAFWSVYLLTPIAIMQFIQNNVERTIFGITIAPQWFGNVNSIVILLFAPLLAVVIKKNTKQLAKTSRYFSLGFMFTGIAFLVLLIGLDFSQSDAKLSGLIVIGYLLLMTLGEICISPASYSLVGELIPEPLRGIMTGASSMNIAIGGLVASWVASKFILPHVNSIGLTVQNSIQLEHVFFIASVILFTIMVISPLLTDKKDKIYCDDLTNTQREGSI